MSKKECIPVLKSVNFIATYEYDLPNDDCLICKSSLMDGCPTCSKTHNVECPISKGVCDHCFHHHCITKWTSESSENCPSCKIKYEHEKSNIDDNKPWKQFVKANKSRK